jgi:hypothetical protein
MLECELVIDPAEYTLEPVRSKYWNMPLQKHLSLTHFEGNHGK